MLSWYQLCDHWRQPKIIVNRASGSTCNDKVGIMAIRCCKESPRQSVYFPPAFMCPVWPSTNNLATAMGLWLSQLAGSHSMRKSMFLKWFVATVCTTTRLSIPYIAYYKCLFKTLFLCFASRVLSDVIPWFHSPIIHEQKHYTTRVHQ